MLSRNVKQTLPPYRMHYLPHTSRAKVSICKICSPSEKCNLHFWRDQADNFTLWGFFKSVEEEIWLRCKTVTCNNKTTWIRLKTMNSCPHLHPHKYGFYYCDVAPFLRLFFSPPSFSAAGHCVQCDVRPFCCSSIMIFLVAELSITQRALMHHESTIRSTDNVIFLLRRGEKWYDPFGINLNGDFDWCNERMVSHWARLCSMFACFPQ